MTDTESELLARLSMHEFLLEILYANALATLDAETRERFIADIMTRVRFRAETNVADGNQALRQQSAMIQFGERFFARAKARV